MPRSSPSPSPDATPFRDTPTRGHNRYVLGVMASASVLVHAAGVVAVGWLALHSIEARSVAVAFAPEPSPSATREFELPVVGEGMLVVDREPDRTGDPVHPAGGETLPRIDTAQSGAGGDHAAEAPALNFAPRDDQIRLSPDLVSHLDRDQIQRIRTGHERASREDRRSTTHPMEATFLASGVGRHEERREPSTANPSRGALEARPAETRGGLVGSPPREIGDTELPTHFGMTHAGSRGSSPGRGVREGRVALDHRSAASISFGRPSLVEGPVATPAILKGRTRDSADADQEVATVVRALVHASTSGGAQGEGRGGNGAGGAPGAGSTVGRGSHTHPLGIGGGDWLDFDSRDPLLLPYFRRLHAKIDPLWAKAFPESALVELKQGTVILEFTVTPEGTVNVAWPPVRPSGIEEFDKKCADAIRRAGPFEPIPRELGRSALRIRAPFVARNPIVH